MINICEQIAWLPMILFCGAPLAQVYLNWRNRSTKRLSPLTVYLVLMGLCCSLVYDYLMCLPFAYRVMHPLILFAWTTLALQEFWYSGSTRGQKQLLYSYGVLFFGIGFAIFWGQYYPVEVGFVTGWLFTIFYAIFQLPQIIKNQREESVEGLSFWYVSMMGAASIAELGISGWRLLPIQSVLNALRGVLVYIIFLYQFMSFGKKVRKRHD